MGKIKVLIQNLTVHHLYKTIKTCLIRCLECGTFDI